MPSIGLYKRVIGLDVHQAQITACALIENPDGSMRIEQLQFGGFKRDRWERADWMASLRPDEVVMESTGIYWKSPYAALVFNLRSFWQYCEVEFRGPVAFSRRKEPGFGYRPRCRRKCG